MRNLFILTLFLSSFSFYGQDTTVNFAIVENSPVYPGCEKEYSNAARKKCMVEKIDTYFRESFDGELGRELGLNGIILVRAEFEIDKSGKPINIFTKASHPRIAEEAKNILKSLPDMRPATQRGRAVAVKLANQFSVDLSKLKEQAKEKPKSLPSSIYRLLKDIVYVRGGTFTMGCTSEQNDCEDDEKPAHPVTLSSFNMGKYEVTQSQWQAVMGSNPSSFKGCGECPVDKVSWNDIQEFIRKLQKLTGKRFRLPTEAEWEFAARGGTRSRGYQYAGGDNLNSVAWFEDNSNQKTHPVGQKAPGQKAPNELGLYDMSGNVWEWCNDWHGGYDNSPSTNPKGPSSGAYRVLRGGSWDDSAPYCRVAFRYYDVPSGRDYRHGFRVVLSQ
jgi:formylglycine-generating enzyme required for sulfatase activity